MSETMTTTDTHAPPRRLKTTTAAAWAALLVAIAALAVSLIHAGPRGAAGPPGSQGPAGQQGPAGADGQDAPPLSYQCQMLFPKDGGAETTMYWPCTDNPNGG